MHGIVILYGMDIWNRNDTWNRTGLGMRPEKVFPPHIRLWLDATQQLNSTVP